MSQRILRVLDASALIAFFQAHPKMTDLLDDAESGRLGLIVPVAAMAVAQAEIDHTSDGWSALLLCPGVDTIGMGQQCAIDVGAWPGDLSTRHTVYEAHALNAVIVTRDPGLYKGYEVRLLVF
ncbi:hypothetical protein ACN27G_27560 [Plantactinospora sp. WMMB334]|uniref:hypothetical protein n=1 Tax=Plantactinospora sp. WMMB334 TaxID=3404119 RepID=UPI003B955315